MPCHRCKRPSTCSASLGRTAGGQRGYDESAVRRLFFIRHAGDLGFSVEDIRQLLALSEHPAKQRQTGPAGPKFAFVDNVDCMSKRYRSGLS